MRNNGRLGYGAKLFVVTLLIYSVACTDGPLQTGQKAAGATRPSLVETLPLPDGQSLLRLGLDDARVVSTYNHGYRSLDPTSYAEQGIVVDSARIEREEWTGLPYARSGGTWLLSGFYLRRDTYHYPPIVISFNAKAPGVAKVVRVHVGTYYWYNSELYPELGEAGLTCYSGASVVGTQRLVLAPPDYWYRGRPEYMPLEVRGDSITSCSAKLGPYVAMDDIEVVFQKEEKTKLELLCSGDVGMNQVTRGRDLQCRVSASDSSATLTNVTWAFVDSAGNAINGPPGALDWGGRMVVPGQMRVSAVVGGDTLSADSAISVQPRAWPSMTVVAVDSGNGHLPAHPTLIQQLADTHPVVPTTPLAVDSIGTGPNTGWAYLSAAITSVRAVVHISAGFSPGTPLYQKQSPGTDPLTGQSFCSKYQFTTVIQTAAREHEGLLSGSTPSHVSVYRQWFNSNNPQISMEAVVGYLPNFSVDYPFPAHVDGKFDDYVSRPAYNDPKQGHSPPGIAVLPSVPCRPRLY